MWKRYEVKWQFENKLCGSVPLNKEMILPWLDSRKPSTKAPGARDLTTVAEEVMTTLAVQDTEAENSAILEKTTLGFQSIEDKLVMRGGTVKAHIKDCARIISSFFGKLQGERSFRVKVINCVNIEEYFIPILKDGKPVLKSDGTFDKAVHVQTPRGERNALKKVHYIHSPDMIFHLLVMQSPKGDIVTLKDIETIFQYGGTHGYAGERGDGEGRYSFKITEKGE